ncbi:MAG: SDR family NAD(P)-dependent oxidoreductase [Pseudomonadota bacterium]
MTQLEGKTAVITGAAQGIGLGIAKALGQAGMNVVLADINVEDLDTAAGHLASLNLVALPVALDVTEMEQWQALADKTIERFGRVDMLVNNAGVSGGIGAVTEPAGFDDAGWRWTLDVNVMGIVYGATVFSPLLMNSSDDAWLINVASMAGLAGMPYAGAYTASKAAVVALSEIWAKELHDTNIHVSVLTPAFVKTLIFDSERNRQPKYGRSSQLTDKQKAFAAFGQDAVEQGISADVLGRRVVEAINNGEFYIMTHADEEIVTLLRERARQIDEAFAQVERSAALSHR